nr:MAG TPA: hypothetical protein [Caudoviricetes sp.]
MWLGIITMKNVRIEIEQKKDYKNINLLLRINSVI